jgi:hypothetical protein
MSDFKPNLEGVQLCIANATRLFDDSQKVSNETGFALKELSLEELMKAWMLYFVFLRDNIKNDLDEFLRYLGGKSMEEVTENLLNSGLNEIGDESKFTELIVRLYEPDLEEAFRFHETKLEYLSDLMTYIRIVVSMKERYSDPISLYQKIVGKYIKPKDNEFWTPDKLIEFLNKFDVKNLDQLKNRREDSIYVNTIEGVLVMPSIGIFATEGLSELVEFLTWSLLVEIDAYIAFKMSRSVKR